MKPFEIHIATATTTPHVLAALLAAGFRELDLFLKIVDVTKHPALGHDITDPYAMLTTHTGTIEEALDLVVRGMTILKQHNVRGNFEIESFNLGSPVPELPVGYRVIENGPPFENHLIWNGGNIPEISAIVQLMEEHGLGMPHQIVDFGPQLCRVATVYQLDRAATEEFHKQASRVQSVLACGVVMEKVLIVGELAS